MVYMYMFCSLFVLQVTSTIVLIFDLLIHCLLLLPFLWGSVIGPSFPDQLKKIIKHYKRVGYSIDIL